MKSPPGALILLGLTLCSAVLLLITGKFWHPPVFQAFKSPKVFQISKSQSVTQVTESVTQMTESVTQSLNCDRMNLMLNHTQRSIIASLGNGRLANQMCNFATCYAIMKEYGMYHYLNTMQLQLLENVFILPEISDSDNASYYLWEEGK